jgi:hypothetical protein
VPNNLPDDDEVIGERNLSPFAAGTLTAGLGPGREGYTVSSSSMPFPLSSNLSNGHATID